MLKPSDPDPGHPTEQRTQTAAFHKQVVRVAANDTDLATEIGHLFGTALDHRITPAEWHRIADSFFHEANGDMHPDQAEGFRDRVFARLTETQSPNTFEDLVRRTIEFFKDAADELCDALIAFVLWTIETGRRHEATDLVFLARDAIPFYVIARHLKARGLPSARLSLLDMNRHMMPRSFDEMAFPGDLVDTQAEQYLAEFFKARHKPLLVDTGLYGTLVRPILASQILPDPAVVFLASKNPHIAGYLNRLEATGDQRSRSPLCPVSELFCDVLENWPKPYTRAELFCEGVRPEPQARLTDPVSATAAFVLYRTAARRARTCNLTELDPTRALHRFAHRFKGNVLAERLPAWPHAERWHAVWSHGPVLPTAQTLARI